MHRTGFGGFTVFVLASGVTLGLAAEQPSAPDRDVMVPVQQLFDAVNRGDGGRAVAAHASPASIIDGFPPYSWQGPTAAADWWRDWEAYSKKHGITEGVATLGKVQQVKVTGDRAYAVASAEFRYAREGKVTESPGTLTLAVRSVGGHWLIAGWAWTH